METSDRELMQRVRDGDREALRALLERYWHPLLAYAAGIVQRRDDAEDIVQDVFIRVWQRREDWTPTGSVNGFLYRIARNLSLNARRDRRTRKKRHEESGSRRSRWRPPRRPDETFDATRLRNEVEEAIEALPERRREIFVLSRFHGMSHREIAEALEISPQTVANQMSSALSTLRELLAHHLDDL